MHLSKLCALLLLYTWTSVPMYFVLYLSAFHWSCFLDFYSEIWFISLNYPVSAAPQGGYLWWGMPAMYPNYFWINWLLLLYVIFFGIYVVQDGILDSYQYSRLKYMEISLACLSWITCKYMIDKLPKFYFQHACNESDDRFPFLQIAYKIKFYLFPKWMS